MERKRILVTGAKGFTGHYISSLFDTDHYETVSLSSDLLNLDGLLREVCDFSPHYVIHLASLSHVTSFDDRQYYEVNLVGTLNVLKVLRETQAPVHKILLPSSANVYGNLDAPCLSEDLLCQPVNHYGVSKLSMEMMARLHFSDLPIVVTRPFNYTGIGQKDNFLIPKIVQAFRNRAPVIELGNTHVFREYLDVRDVCDIYKTLLLSDARGIVVNVCRGRGYSISEILALCQDISNHSIEVRVNPQFVRPNELESLIGSPDELHSHIGAFQFRDMRETLGWMLNA